MPPSILPEAAREFTHFPQFAKHTREFAAAAAMGNVCDKWYDDRRAGQENMEKLTSILVVMDPADESRHVLAKAIVLARHFKARLELFLCDSEHAYSLRHAYDVSGVERARQECLAEAGRFLEAVRRSVAEDIPISLQVACESPLYEGVVHRALEARPDLVIKSAAGQHSLRRFTLDANDWQLARTCPVPLMLTRGRPWSAQPKFAAAVDVATQGGADLARSILHTAGYLALGCRAGLDVVYSERKGAERADQAAHAATLTRLVREFSIGKEQMHLLQGDAEQMLPAFAKQRRYDVLVLGALTQRRGLSALVGSLTSRLVDNLDCDFVLVKPDTYSSPVTEPVQAAAG
jgi:universal stress protein E